MKVKLEKTSQIFSKFNLTINISNFYNLVNKSLYLKAKVVHIFKVHCVGACLLTLKSQSKPLVWCTLDHLSNVHSVNFLGHLLWTAMARNLLLSRSSYHLYHMGREYMYQKITIYNCFKILFITFYSFLARLFLMKKN